MSMRSAVVVVSRCLPHDAARVQRSPTSHESIKPLSVCVLSCQLTCLSCQPNRAAYQLLQRVILDENAQVESGEAIQNDGFGEVALTQTVFCGVAVVVLLVVGLETEANVGETTSIQVAETPGERPHTLASDSTRPVSVA